MDNIGVRVYINSSGELWLDAEFWEDSNIKNHFGEESKVANHFWEAEILYALVPENRVIRQRYFAQEAAGGYYAFVNHERPVLQGFRFDYDIMDHHLDEIGIRFINNGLLRVVYNDENDDDQFNSEVWWAELDITSGLSDLEPIPHGFQLKQNYPNPFNPSTNITFSLSKSMQVRLDIFDLHGKIIDTLVDETLPFGDHLFTFNATGLASGLYIYRLKGNDHSETKKMLLIQ